MKLVASVVVKDEVDRYLQPFLSHLCEFVDEIVVLDDASTDGTAEVCEGFGATVHRNETPGFYAHEGQTRQRLLDQTMEARPTHILAIDADEFVENGANLRERIQRSGRGIWALQMEEIWEVDDDRLRIRTDGQWGPWPVPVLYAIPPRLRNWRIHDQALACGRVPLQIAQQRTRAERGGSILHFGWANATTRTARYQRYAVHDGGQFHRSDHLESIMFTADRVQLRARPWPDMDPAIRYRILRRANEVDPDAKPGPPADSAFSRIAPDGRWVALGFDGTVTTGSL